MVSSKPDSRATADSQAATELTEEGMTAQGETALVPEATALAPGGDDSEGVAPVDVKYAPEAAVEPGLVAQATAVMGDATKFACGAHSAAIKSDGSLWTWGPTTVVSWATVRPRVARHLSRS